MIKEERSREQEVKEKESKGEETKEKEVKGEETKEREEHKETQVNTKHKDGLFRMIFTDKKELLSLYNALSGRDYQDPEEILITTLVDAIYIGIKNDISYIIDGRISFYEHQSTWCGNMPLRTLFYISRVYSVFTSNQNLYAEQPVTLPNPHFIMFYNGVKEREDKTILKLSDAYEHKNEEIQLELKVLVFNINEGHNKELMEECKSLKDYAYYVARVRENTKTMPIEDAVDVAVQHCIDHHILEEFLRQQKGRVKEMNLNEYDHEAHMEQLKKEAMEEGVELGLELGRGEGLELGREEGLELGTERTLVSTIRKMYQKDFIVDQIRELLEVEKSYVETVIEFIEENREMSDREIVECMHKMYV